MKVTIKHNGEEEIFQYSPEATIQEVREMAAEKYPLAGLSSTQLTVRKYPLSDKLSPTKTFQQLGLEDKDHLIVDVRKDNKEAKTAGRLIRGEQHTTKKDVRQLLTQARNNQEENIRHHEASNS